MKNAIIKILIGLLVFLIAMFASYILLSNSSRLRYENWRTTFRKERLTGAVPITRYVDITGCKATPSLAYSYASSSIKFLNDDDRNHVVFFKSGRFTVPARGSADIKLDFLGYPGGESYNCDTVKNIGAIGIIRIASSLSASSTNLNQSR